MRPETLPFWTAPGALNDSLTSLREGNAHTYWFQDDTVLMAIAPILSVNSIPVGLMVARMSTAAAMLDVRRAR